jgi:hypothetical protein
VSKALIFGRSAVCVRSEVMMGTFGTDSRRRTDDCFGFVQKHLGLLIVSPMVELADFSELIEGGPGARGVAETTARHGGYGKVERSDIGAGTRLGWGLLERCELIDDLDRSRGLAGPITGQCEGATILRVPIGVIRDDLTGGLEPARGHAVIVGLAAGPQNGKPARLVQARGVFGSALGDLDRGRPQAGGQAGVGP